MQLSLRQKMSLIVAVVTSAFIFLMAVSWYLDIQMENQTAMIRDHFIPHVELGYRLESQFDGIGLRLRDAVSAQDIHELDSIVELKANLMNELDSASGIIDPHEIADAKAAVEDYVAIAADTSKRLIQGETGLTIVDSMTRMQSKRSLAASLLSKVTNFDRNKLRESFVSIYGSHARSARIRLWVSFICVVFIFAVSTLMGRALMARLQAISTGLARFGEGEFSHPIPIVGQDELSELSRQVNRMAVRIQSLMRELESFSYSIAHDLRAPLRSVIGFSAALAEDHTQSLSDEGKSDLARISAAGRRMESMIDGLLGLSRLNRKTINKAHVDISKLSQRIVDVLKSNDPDRNVTVQIQENLLAWGDAQLLDIALANLIGNAWKFTKRTDQPRIEVGSKKEDRTRVFFVRDNGAGFDMRYAEKLFGTFQRLHSDSEFEGHGIGLATVRNIIEKHGGRIWAESEPNKGAVFFFTLG